MNNHTLKVLEYRSILERLKHHCRSVPGRRRADALLPYDNLDGINSALDLVSEMNEIFEFDGGPPGLVFEDLAEKLERARSDAYIFEPKQLLEFAGFFKIVYDCQRIRSEYKKLHELLAKLVYPSSLHREIENAVDLSGEIKDSASPELKRLRKELTAVKATLNEKFERYLRSDTAAYLSDNLYTIRDGRYVLPVRETDKGRVRGIIHDRSSSGATFFIEPSETVELNNHHRELETAEREEINRILRHLSELLYVNMDAIKEDVSTLSHLDFIAACSRLSRELGGSRPIFSEDGDELAIVKGRHPELLLGRDKEDKGGVVPLDIGLTRDENIMIITGPNTGGKTVALKTAGLLSLMAASALYVPADSRSRFIIFDEIFADIGDEQSIESSLSTYSSHLNHIKEALEQADRNSLVLFDELGAGTDPEEGAAMGQAMIEYLSARRCFAIVTTHQGKLKALAGKVPGVVNGSMEFDRRNLRPTFVFHAGIPGSSYAVEIGRKLGLSNKITDRAWELLDQKERDLTNLIAEINQKSIQLSEELKKAIADRLSYESLAKIYKDKLEAWQVSEREMRKKQLKESEELINSTRMELDRLLEAAREKKKDREAIRTIRKEVAQKLETAREERSKMETAPSYVPARGLPGEKVHVRGIDANGEVLEPADSSGRVRVRIGNATMLTDLENLSSRSETSGPERRSPAKVKTDYQPAPGMEIDIRGMTFDEAEPIIERFLDDSANAGMESVSIIHGKGTGALRKKVQVYLDQNPRVEAHRLGYWNEGSSGVTVVTLKKE
jgi:DNA mismatch repair protein MutS2